MFVYVIGGQTYKLPCFASPFKRPGEPVAVGDILWSGVMTSGDRLFVERLSSRFGKPERGDVIVFRGTGIQGLPVNTLYIKRVADLPGECLRIEPPYLIVNDQKVTQPEIFNIIATTGSNGYAGFQVTGHHGLNSGLLAHASDEMALGQNEYFVLGDNTTNSLDSRYYGPVPGTNIFGKAARIYWPLTRINALK
jgi:signal peptidase I